MTGINEAFRITNILFFSEQSSSLCFVILFGDLFNIYSSISSKVVRFFIRMYWNVKYPGKNYLRTLEEVKQILLSGDDSGFCLGGCWQSEELIG